MRMGFYMRAGTKTPRFSWEILAGMEGFACLSTSPCFPAIFFQCVETPQPVYAQPTLYLQVLQLQPNNAHAYFRRAFAHKSVQKFDEAAEDFESAR